MARRLEAAERAWAATFDKWAAFRLEDGQFIGRGGISEIELDDGRSVVEVGWALLPAFWGRGYATEIGVAGIRFGFDEVGVIEIVSFTDHDNEASQAVMRRLGLRHVGDCSWGGRLQILYSSTGNESST